MERYRPTAALSPYIRSFLIIESEEGITNTILPESSMVMAVRYNGHVTLNGEGAESTLPPAIITGLRRSSRTVTYSKATANMLVVFRETGAAMFFKEPLHELFGLSVSLDNLVQRPRLIELEERLAGAANNTHRVAVMEQFLISELKSIRHDPLVEHAVQTILSAGGSVRVKDLLKELPISRDPFEKRFRRITGSSPKQFSGIIRLKTLIGHHTQTESLTEAAHTAGYFDQAHFIKDFKTFTGQTPRDFFRSGPYW